MIGRAATYSQIQREVARSDGFVPKTCWIADVMASNGVPIKLGHNRKSTGTRQVPCPPAKRQPIEAALHRLGVL